MKNIKELKIHQIEECAKLFVKTFNEEPWNEKWTLDKALKRILDYHKSAGFKGSIYIEEGKIIGVILGNKEQWFNGEIFSIKEFYVDSSVQGKGIGKKLITKFEKELKEEGISSVQFWTLKGSMALEFYKKLGYEVSESYVIMEKNL